MKNHEKLSNCSSKVRWSKVNIKFLIVTVLQFC